MSGRILVIGDSIADVYRMFEYRKQCPDAPETPVGLLSCMETRAGGAANVAANLAALVPSDRKIDLISVLDIDIARALKYASLNRVDISDCLIVDREQSLRKERILFDRLDGRDRSLMVRLDNRTSIDPIDADGVRNAVHNYFESHSIPELVVVSDYDGGVLTDGLLEELRCVMHLVVVDTKRTDLSCFSGCLLAKLNAIEYDRVLANDASPERHARYFIVTRGEMGARLIMRSGFDEERSTFPYHVFGSRVVTTDFSARDADVVDVCGCGDTFLAGVVAGIIRYGDPFEAVSFANAAAATVVSQSGVSVADLQATLVMTGREVGRI